jgi:hypothetical protein
LTSRVAIIGVNRLIQGLAAAEGSKEDDKHTKRNYQQSEQSAHLMPPSRTKLNLEGA